MNAIDVENDGEFLDSGNVTAATAAIAIATTLFHRFVDVDADEINDFRRTYVWTNPFNTRKELRYAPPVKCQPFENIVLRPSLHVKCERYNFFFRSQNQIEIKIDIYALRALCHGENDILFSLHSGTNG